MAPLPVSAGAATRGHLVTEHFFWYNAHVSSAVLTAQDVAEEVERLATESAFGYVHVIVADGRIERIDRCVQTKAARPGRRGSVPIALQRAAESS